MKFTRLPARGKSSFDELYAEIREWLGHRKCPNQIVLFGKTFYERRHYSLRCIRGIMFSPHGNKDFNRILAKDIIGSANDFDCRVLESHLPYKGK